MEKKPQQYSISDEILEKLQFHDKPFSHKTTTIIDNDDGTVTLYYTPFMGEFCGVVVNEELEKDNYEKKTDKTNI